MATRSSIRCAGVVFAILVPLLFAGASWADAFEEGYTAYESGRYGEAYRLWLPLAEAGDANAEYLIGLLHDRGLGVARDEEKASIWYRRAANQRFVPAEFALGVLYERWWRLARGQSHPPMPPSRYFAEAESWFLRARENGHEQADTSLRRLREAERQPATILSTYATRPRETPAPAVAAETEVASPERERMQRSPRGESYPRATTSSVAPGTPTTSSRPERQRNSAPGRSYFWDYANNLAKGIFTLLGVVLIFILYQCIVRLFRWLWGATKTTGSVTVAVADAALSEAKAVYVTERRRGRNSYVWRMRFSIGGAIIGAILGSNLGIAGFGGAIAGTIPVAVIGFFIGRALDRNVFSKK